MIGIWQLVLIFAIILVLFGAGKIPRIMKDLGSGIRAFKNGLEGDEKDALKEVDLLNDKIKKGRKSKQVSSGKGSKKTSKSSVKNNKKSESKKTSASKKGKSSSDKKSK